MMIQDLMTKLKSLEDREADREVHITVQEDTIQILSAEVEELKGKMCRCQDSPCISQGSSRVESPYELEGEQPEASLSSGEGRLWPIQGGERRGEMATPDIDPNDVGPSDPVFTLRVFADDVVIEGVIAVYFCTYFHHFYPTSKPSFFLFTRSRHTNNKTRHKRSSYRYKETSIDYIVHKTDFLKTV